MRGIPKVQVSRLLFLLRMIWPGMPITVSFRSPPWGFEENPWRMIHARDGVWFVKKSHEVFGDLEDVFNSSYNISNNILHK